MIEHETKAPTFQEQANAERLEEYKRRRRLHRLFGRPVTDFKPPAWKIKKRF